MSELGRMSAVFFDMDGTLIDSETLTEPTIVAVCSEFGVNDVDIDCIQFFGRSWLDVERELIRCYPQLDAKANLAARMENFYHNLLCDEQPPLIPGSRDALIAVSELMPVAIVSSSSRESIAATIRRMDIADHVSYFAGFEDYDNHKPEPDGFLRAAEVLRIDPKNCLVFEDSIVGIQAAKSAGMAVVAVTHRCADLEAVTDLANMTIRDYLDLGEDFYDSINN